MKARRPRVNSDELYRSLNSDVRLRTVKKKTMARKGKYDLPKSDPDGGEADTGILKDLAATQPFTRNNFGYTSNETTHYIPSLTCVSVEAPKDNTPTADVWHHDGAPSDTALSLINPMSNILSVTHDNGRSFSEPARAPPSPWTNYSDSKTKLDSEKVTSSLEQPTAWKKSPSPDNKVIFKTEISDNEEFDRSTFRVSQNEKCTVDFEFSAEKARRWADAIDVPEGLYNEEEKDLFFRLAMRGFEALIPEQWKSDFRTLPDTLFSDAEDDLKPLIQAFKTPTTYAIKSLANLFSLGGRVRDCRVIKKGPEILIKTTIMQYIRWALCDTNLDAKPDAIPVYVIYAQKKGEATLDAVKKLNGRLQLLASRYRKALNMTAPDEDQNSTSLQPNRNDDGSTDALLPHPLLIGFIICGPILAILTLGTEPPSAPEDTDSKFISQFDFEDIGHDVWNSLAVAIAVMKIRKTMMRLSNEGLGGFVRPPRGTESTRGVDL
ncbi:hypothetical protein BDV28DRAFT_35650 [Aspergillus coremiiformis]|uniref:Uncharacterized protein n=1 Tax=Aspergillus coremiiformis TaxID=138285 RepID=A0A5N6Z3R4_9EURO|nr:hypothetical protein BDV28DRAFT_35650 [Aspergillus coremiiformis]